MITIAGLAVLIVISYVLSKTKFDQGKVEVVEQWKQQIFDKD
jgi:hypothetical protein